MGIRSKLEDSLSYRGVLGTVGLILMLPFKLVVEHTSLLNRRREYKDRRYDTKYGVDTGGQIHLTELSIKSPNSEHGQRYEGSDPDVFDRMMKYLPISHKEFTFIDFGSGKGRALLLASDYPFKEIIGIEFSPQLHAVAERNIGVYTNPERKCTMIQSICVDATTYRLPSGKLVLFMANPFNEPVMSRVLESLRQSLASESREVFIIYTNPQCDHLFANADFLQPIIKKGWFSIYRHPGHSSAHI